MAELSRLILRYHLIAEDTDWRDVLPSLIYEAWQ